MGEEKKRKPGLWRKAVRVIGRGEFISEEYLPHMAWTIMLIIAGVVLAYFVENRQLKMREGRKDVETWRIYCRQTEYELEKTKRITNLEKELRKNGSKVGIPKKRAVELDRHGNWKEQQLEGLATERTGN